MSNENEENRLTIRGVSNEILIHLDEISERENYTSRNQLIVEILERFVADKDSFIVNNLPNIVRSMVEQELKRVSNNADEIINDVYQSCVKIIRISQKFENFLYPELQKTDTKNLNNAQLLAILDSIDKD